MASIKTFFDIMFACCAAAYWLAWPIIKNLVPKYALLSFFLKKTIGLQIHKPLLVVNNDIKTLQNFIANHSR
jgi:hypothetical protein